LIECDINRLCSLHRYIGSYRTKEEAACAYDREARQCAEEKLLNYDSLELAEAAAERAHANRTQTRKRPGSAPGKWARGQNV
jgi:hypothetical protein